MIGLLLGFPASLAVSYLVSISLNFDFSREFITCKRTIFCHWGFSSFQFFLLLSSYFALHFDVVKPFCPHKNNSSCYFSWWLMTSATNSDEGGKPNGAGDVRGRVDGQLIFSAHLERITNTMKRASIVVQADRKL